MNQNENVMKISTLDDQAKQRRAKSSSQPVKLPGTQPLKELCHG